MLIAAKRKKGGAQVRLGEFLQDRRIQPLFGISEVRRELGRVKIMELRDQLFSLRRLAFPTIETVRNRNAMTMAETEDQFHYCEPAGDADTSAAGETSTPIVAPAAIGPPVSRIMATMR